MNHYFQFKKFTVHQDRCAMKVCTDACLFGAFVASRLELLEQKAGDSLLDIGTGTGLLSLMIAQKCNLSIDAIEIEEAACQQAMENFKASEWKDRLSVTHQDLNNFIPEKKYQFIVSNPPFFENDLPSVSDKRNVAMHSSDLTLNGLFSFVDLHLKREGSFFLLMPFSRHEEVMGLLKNIGFYVNRLVLVRQTERHNHFRVMYEIKKEETPAEALDICIKINNEYSSEFVGLLKDYYLYL